MPNNSKAKIIADVLMSDVNRRWTWDEILEAMRPGIFSVVPKQYAREILATYVTYLPHVYAELDSRGKFLLREGRSWKASFKIATIEDREEVESRLKVLEKRKESVEGRIKERIGNLKQEKILPRSWRNLSLNA